MTAVAPARSVSLPSNGWSGAAPGRRAAALQRVRAYALPVLGVCLLILAAWVLHRALAHVTYAELSNGIAALSRWRIVGALGFTALSFLTLAGYEQCALRHIGKPQPWRRAWLAAFLAQSISHSTGLATLVGTGLRYRFYSAKGLELADVARIQLFFSTTFVLGVMTLSGLALAAEPGIAAAVVPLPLAWWRGLGALSLLSVVAYLAWSATHGSSGVKLGRYRLVMPAGSTLVQQMALALIDMGAASAALYVLLPEIGVSYPAFLGMFTVAVVIGVASNVPGGLGVLESMLLLMLQPAAEQLPSVLGGLMMFRAIYYLLPLFAGACVLGVIEWRQSARLHRTMSAALRSVSPLAPLLFSLLTFVAGAALLISGVLPAEPERLRALAELLPQPFIELSHLTGSLAGTALLLLASSLRRRVTAAWAMTAALLTLGAVTSLLKGLHYEEAVMLLAVLGALLASRREFYRRASLLDVQPSRGWIAAIVLTFAATLWLIGFVHSHVDYANELWWQVALQADAPRSLRATLGAAVLLGAFGLLRLLRPATARPRLPAPGELQAARGIAARGIATTDWLALTGDKALLFSEARDAFVMYGVIGRSWIAMGQPAGPEPAWPELIWRFHEQAKRHDARTVFYEVPGRALKHFLDLGLSTLKLGESARVDLASFDLRGKRRANIRHGHGRAQKGGARFEVLTAEEAQASMDRLEGISNEWLARHNTREKRFSLGFFGRDYISRMPVAVVTVEKRIVAFANLWLSGDGSVCSPDLMRYGSGAPKSVMDFLMVEIMLWAKARGYRWYELGMAPLSGLPGHRLAPLSSKLGRLLYHHGGGFYNFEGLRAFKNKFDPVWEPVYLVYCGALPRVLADVAAIVAGGWVGVIRK